MDFKLIIEDWSRYYYSATILLLTELIALFLFFRVTYTDKIRKAFLIYLLSDLLFLLIGSIISGFPDLSKNFINKYYGLTNLFIANIELFVYYYFFSNFFSSKKVNSILSIVSSIFFSFSIYYAISNIFSSQYTYIHTVVIISTVGYICLLIPCIFYYTFILKEESKLSILERPSFWVTTGIFFYSTTSIPFYLLYIYFFNSHYEKIDLVGALFYYLPFIINILILIRANSCKKPFTT